jgi:CHAD domain-containing protein
MQIKEPLESYTLLGAEVMLKLLNPLAGEIKGVRKAKDAECVHRMRVTARRMNMALRLFSGCFPEKNMGFWKREIRRIRKSLGKARDADVQIDFVRKYIFRSKSTRSSPGIRRLLLRLKQKRKKLQNMIISSLDRLLKSSVLEHMEQSFRKAAALSQMKRATVLCPPVFRKAGRLILLQLKELLSYEQSVCQPDKKEELHAMRIEAKHLRYTMEIFERIYGKPLKDIITACRDLQDILGAIHDADVWLEFLPEFLKKEQKRFREHSGNLKGFSKIAGSIMGLEKDLMLRRKASCNELSQYWKKLRDGRTWEKLCLIAEKGSGRSSRARQKPRTGNRCT